MRQIYLLISLLFFAVLSICCQHSLSLAEVENPLAAATEHLVDNGSYAVTGQGRYIATHNLENLYMPASIVKIATALAALEILGPEFRFSTNFYLDEQQNLYIKGFGDPFLISEEVAAIVSGLQERGCRTVNNIYLDDSAFAISGLAEGAGLTDNPYDAQNSSLAVNFNTVNFKKDKYGKISSAEEQTPTIPMMTELAAAVAPGTHRINITRDIRDGAKAISRYTGELFRALMQQENIAVEGIIARRPLPENLMPFYTHLSSRSLKDIIGPLMLYSNNFIANQLFLAIGAAKFDYPATWEKGRQAMTGFLHTNYSLTAKEIKIVEGSGLSRKNRVSAGAMIRLLDSFKPYAGLLPREGGILLKSGTLEGVYSYAGYFEGNDGFDSFVLMLNQDKNNRDKLLKVLKEFYRAKRPRE